MVEERRAGLRLALPGGPRGEADRNWRPERVTWLDFVERRRLVGPLLLSPLGGGGGLSVTVSGVEGEEDFRGGAGEADLESEEGGGEVETSLEAGEASEAEDEELEVAVAGWRGWGRLGFGFESLGGRVEKDSSMESSE